MGNGTVNLYHRTGWSIPLDARPGESFTLVPGGQCAEGKGVYFAETPVRPQTAEGCRQAVRVGLVKIALPPELQAGWWKSKSIKTRRFGKPRTWHTYGRSITLTVTSTDGSEIVCNVKKIG